MEIKGKTAIITGATGRLAGAIVLMMAKAGANCVCIYHKNKTEAKKLQAALGRLKIKSLFIQTNLTRPGNIEKVFADIERFAKPRILINAAAVFEKKLIKDISSEYIGQTVDINFTAAMEMTQKFVKLVRKKIKQEQNLSSTTIGEPAAKIINIADIAAQRPPAGFSIYCASKAALIAATKSLAKELAPDFTVNAVSPGIINWQKDVTKKQKKKILTRIPAGRAGKPEEVAQAVRLLIENDYITGQIINVDGGRSI